MKIYIEKEVYEDVCLFDDFPVWQRVFADGNDVHFNSTQEELDEELYSMDSPLLLFQQAYPAAQTPKSDFDFFSNLYKDLSEVAPFSSAVFILNLTEEEAKEASKKYGSAIISSKSLSDNFLTGGFKKDVFKNDQYEHQWKDILKFPLPPLNALILSDPYLFSVEKKNRNNKNVELLGFENVLLLLDAILPKELDIPFHLCVISGHNGKGTTWWNREFGKFKARAILLRAFELKIELVLIGKIPHKRRIISNYFTGWSDHGFKMFTGIKLNTVNHDNDIHLHKLYNGDLNSGDSYKTMSENGLHKLKKKCAEASDISHAFGNNTNTLVIGDCNKDKSIANRLFNN